MSDLIDRNAFRKAMYHEAMEKDSDEQKWDSGCWIRYKMFERVLRSMPSVQPTQKNESNTLDALDCVSRGEEESAQPDVIMCKDCIHRYTACPMTVRTSDGYISFFTDDNDFCSRARAKGEEE